MATSTPWGKSQYSKQLARGIVFYSTASHGGIHLTDSRIDELKAVLPHFQPFTGDFHWLEEDDDAAVVYLVWPELAGGRQAEYVVGRRGKESKYGPFSVLPDTYWDSPQAQQLIAKAAEYQKEKE